MRIKSRESGQALVFTAVALIPLLGFVGLSVDMGMMRYQKRVEQTAADAAALAGASNLTFGGVQAGGQAAATANGFTDNTGGGSCASSTNTTVGSITVTICNAPQDLTINGIAVPGGPHTSDVTTSSGAVAPAADYVEAIVSVVQPTYFMQIFGVTSETVIARAVATNFSGATLGPNAGCLYTLYPPSTTGVNGVDIQGSAALKAPNCGILDNGNYDPTGNSPNLIIQAGSFSVSGSDTGSKKLPTCTVTPDQCPVYGSPATSDPMASLQPPCTNCVNSNNYSSNSTSTVPCSPSPCLYNSISFAGNGTETFSPGTYVISGGGVSCSGTPAVTGTGVTFYFTNGASWNCTGNDHITLTAPTSGTYQDVLFYQDPNDHTTFSLGGDTNSTYNGIIYTPGAQVTFFGNSKGNNGGIVTDIVIAAAVDFFGNPTVSLAGIAGLPAPPPPAFTAGNATLVE